MRSGWARLLGLLGLGQRLHQPALATGGVLLVQHALNRRASSSLAALRTIGSAVLASACTACRATFTCVRARECRSRFRTRRLTFCRFRFLADSMFANLASNSFSGQPVHFTQSHAGCLGAGLRRHPRPCLGRRLRQMSPRRCGLPPPAAPAMPTRLLVGSRGSGSTSGAGSFVAAVGLRWQPAVRAQRVAHSQPDKHQALEIGVAYGTACRRAGYPRSASPAACDGRDRADASAGQSGGCLAYG